VDSQGSELRSQLPDGSGAKRQRRDAAPALRVLIDARKLGHGGIGTYTENLIAGMLGLSNGAPFAEVGLLGTASVIRKYPWAAKVEIVEDSARPYSLDELFRLGRRVSSRITAGRYRLFHSPHFVLPYGLPIPAVVTVHDLIHVNNPQRRYYPLIAKPLIRSAIRRAREVLAVSRATYDELVDFADNDTAIVRKLHIIPNALDPAVRETAEERRRVGNGTRRNYFAAVFSTLKPHKGLGDLLQAFRLLKSSAASDSADALGIGDLKLVLVGQGFERTTASASDRELIRQAEGTRDVLVFGRLSKAELCNVYAEARAFVMPAITEGFSLPVLEAQAFGTPVIARPSAAVKELLSPSATLSENFSIAALSAAMRRGLERAKSADGNEIETRADEVSRNYDITDVARAVVQVYRQAIEPGCNARGRA
jgi:glycosyltransferase involved in cell wall biosynthesis